MPRWKVQPCQFQPLMGTSQERSGGNWERWEIKQAFSLDAITLRSSTSFLFPTKVAHALCQHKPSRVAFSTYFQVNPDKNATRATVEGTLGNLHAPLTWSGRALLNPHWFCQIDTNCPSEELRFILKRLNTQVFKLHWVMSQTAFAFVTATCEISS